MVILINISFFLKNCLTYIYVSISLSRFVNASPPLPPPRRGSESVPGSPQHFRTRIHYTPEPQRRIYRTIDQWVALQIMVMWYWYGFVDDDNVDVAAAAAAAAAATTPNPHATEDLDVDFIMGGGANDSNALPLSSSSARDFLTTRSFSHTGSVSERLDSMVASSSSSTTQLNEDFHNTPASAPAFSSLSLDAADMYTARMRRAKYWLQK